MEELHIQGKPFLPDSFLEEKEKCQRLIFLFLVLLSPTLIALNLNELHLHARIRFFIF